jgi:hypothetical protein
MHHRNSMVSFPCITYSYFNNSCKTVWFYSDVSWLMQQLLHLCAEWQIGNAVESRRSLSPSVKRYASCWRRCAGLVRALMKSIQQPSNIITQHQIEWKCIQKFSKRNTDGHAEHHGWVWISACRWAVLTEGFAVFFSSSRQMSGCTCLKHFWGYVILSVGTCHIRSSESSVWRVWFLSYFEDSNSFLIMTICITVLWWQTIGGCFRHYLPQIKPLQLLSGFSDIHYSLVRSFDAM